MSFNAQYVSSALPPDALQGEVPLPDAPHAGRGLYGGAAASPPEPARPRAARSPAGAASPARCGAPVPRSSPGMQPGASRASPVQRPGGRWNMPLTRLRTAPHLPACTTRRPRPLLLTPERRLSILGACGGSRSSPRAAPKVLTRHLPPPQAGAAARQLELGPPEPQPQPLLHQPGRARRPRREAAAGSGDAAALGLRPLRPVGYAGGPRLAVPATPRGGRPRQLGARDRPALLPPLH